MLTFLHSENVCHGHAIPEPSHRRVRLGVLGAAELPRVSGSP